MSLNLLDIILKQPELLLEHIEGYSLLVQEELAIQTAYWQRLIWLYSVFMFSLGTGSVLIGVACLISVSHFGLEVHSMGIMLVLATTPLWLAYFCWDAMKKLPRQGSVGRILTQVRADVAVFSERIPS